MIVIDNYFKYPDTIRNYALDSVKYYPKQPNDGWQGYRSSILSEDNNIEKEIILKIEDTLKSNYQTDFEKIAVFFHCSPITIMERINDFHDMKWHDDICDYAGVIYLNPNPPKNTGTCFKNGNCIENIYNRFLSYSGYLIHGPDHLFGRDLETTRLTITFFAWIEFG